MKYNNQKMISKVLATKTNRYVRVSNISFTLSIVLFAVVSIFVWNQYQEIKVNFVDNEKTHIIEISGQVKNDEYIVANNNFKKDICSLLNEKEYSDEYECFSIYQFVTMPAVKELPGETVAVFSVDQNGEKYWLPGYTMQNNCVYTSYKSKDAFTLLVPTAKIVDGDYYFGDEKEFHMNAVTIDKADDSFRLYSEEFQVVECYVNFDTFKNLNEYSVGKEDIDTTHEIVVYVKDMTKVERIAKLLNSAGYTTNFVFESFEEIGQSLGTSLVIMLALSVLMLVVTFAILLLSWKNYISLLSKDIGILKQMGYEERFIKKVYQLSIRWNFLFSAALVILITVIVSMIVLGTSQLLFALALVFVLILLFVLSYWIICNIFLRKQLKKNVLELIKDKTFE